MFSELAFEEVPDYPVFAEVQTDFFHGWETRIGNRVFDFIDLLEPFKNDRAIMQQVNMYQGEIYELAVTLDANSKENNLYIIGRFKTAEKAKASIPTFSKMTDDEIVRRYGRV